MKNMKTFKPAIKQSAITEALRRQNMPRIDSIGYASHVNKQAVQAYDRGDYSLAIILADKAIDALEHRYHLKDNELRKLSPPKLRKIKALPEHALFQSVPVEALLIMEHASELKEDAQYAISFEHYARNFMKPQKVAVYA